MSTTERSAARGVCRAPKRRKKARRSRQRDTAHTVLNGRVMFEVRSYDGKEIKTSRLMTRAQVLQSIDFSLFDCVLAMCLGIFGFRDPETRELIPFARVDGRGRGIGPAMMCILEALQDAPGVHLDPSMLYQLTELDSVPDGGNLNTYVLRLRDAFWERKATSRFILTDGGRVAWAPEHTWVRVTLFIRKATNGTPANGGDYNAKGEEQVKGIHSNSS